MPAARVDDGLLDIVSIGPRGIVGWLAVTARVLGRRRRGHRIVQHWQGRTVIISAESPQWTRTLVDTALGSRHSTAVAGAGQ